jgi:2-hydroxychromene-2-carboxylate isomerase
MTAPIDFHFDFSSPYGYFASERIDALAARYARQVRWRPHLLGVVFKATGAAPLPSIPLKGAYALRDMVRTAAFLGIPYRHPDPFPVSAVIPARAFYWLEGRDAGRAKALAHALFRAYFVHGSDISRLETVLSLCTGLGMDPVEARAGIEERETRERTRREVEQALAKGVFGSPYIVVDGEPFWGSDRMDQIERWLATGGW